MFEKLKFWKGSKKGKVFEDEFMELQTGLIALCMEVTEGNIDKVFAYGSNEKKSKSFNAFFEKNGEILTLRQLGIHKELIRQFLRVGTEDLVGLDAIGEKYGRPVPTELKLLYDVRTKKFRSDYRYEEICSARTGRTAADIFDEWIAEMKG